MNTLSILQSRSGRTTRFGYDFESGLHDLVQRGDVDCSIQSAEMGFSPLGASRDFLGDALGVYHRTLNMLANSVQRSDQVSLIGVPAWSWQQGRAPAAISSSALWCTASPIVTSFITWPTRALRMPPKHSAPASYACRICPLAAVLTGPWPPALPRRWPTTAMTMPIPP